MVKLNKIYTRTGDGGTTGLTDGGRIAKNDPRIAAIGEVDELNSTIGFARVADLRGEGAMLGMIQNDLFDLGADLATPGADFTPSDMVLRVIPAQVDWLEQQIDRLNADLEPLNSFVLPGGNEGAARVHLARAIARRAERAVIAAAQDNAINPAAVTYLNRLSDLLFVLARWLNDGGAADVKWVPGASRQREG